MKKLTVFLLLAGFASAQPFPFSFWKTAAGGGGGTPQFNAELNDRWTETSSNSTSPRTLVGSVAVGHTIVVAIGWESGTQTVSSVSDSAGNTYKLSAVNSAWDGGNSNIQIATAYCTSSLSAGGSVTINWASPANTYRTFAYFDITGAATNATQYDQTGNAKAFGTSVTGAASTTASTTCCIGIVSVASPTNTYGSSSWTVSGAAQNWPDGVNASYFVWKNVTSAASQDPGGTITVNSNYGVLWVAIK